MLYKPNSPVEKDQDDGDEGSDIPDCRNNAITLETSDAVLLRVVPIRVIGQHGVVTTIYAMLDSGSEITLVDPSLIEQLRVQGRSDQLVVSTVGDKNDLQHGC